jgi:hypothetical protein
MKRFCVQVKGENLLFNLDGEHQLFGMEATCFVMAEDEQLAGKTALAKLMLAPTLKERLVDEGQCRASYVTQSITELSWFEYFRKKRSEKVEFQLVEVETP